MKGLKLLWMVSGLIFLLSACGNSSKSADKKSDESSIDTISNLTQDSIIDAAAEIDNSQVTKPIHASDTLPTPKKIIHTNKTSPIEKTVREMPRPGVSEQDKRYIDSIKAARRKLKD